MKIQSSKFKAQEKVRDPRLKADSGSATARVSRGILMLLIWSFSGALSLVLGASDDPAAEQASFEVADGFAVNLFASEKEGVIKPIQMRFDARGRLWVIGSTVYPEIEDRKSTRLNSSHQIISYAVFCLKKKKKKKINKL